MVRVLMCFLCVTSLAACSTSPGTTEPPEASTVREAGSSPTDASLNDGFREAAEAADAPDATQATDAGDPCLAATYYVSPSGSDKNPGTSKAPFASFQRAANAAAAPGDVVCFRAGTYYEDQLSLTHSGTSSSPIVFAAYPGESVVVDFGLRMTQPWTKTDGDSGATVVYAGTPEYGSAPHYPAWTVHVIVGDDILSPITTCPSPASAATCVPRLTPGLFYSDNNTSDATQGKLFIAPPSGVDPNSTSVVILNADSDIHATGLYSFAFDDPNMNDVANTHDVADNIVLDGFVFQGGSSGVTIADYSAKNPHQNFTLKNCEIRYSQAYSINVGNWDGVTIDGCNVHHNGLFNYPRGIAPGVGWPGTIMGDADQWNFGSPPGNNGLTPLGTVHFVLENSQIHDNNGEGVIAGSYWTIQNNVFYDNYSVNIYLMPPWGDNVGAGHTLVDSNLVYDTGKYIGTSVGTDSPGRNMPDGIRVANEGSDQHGHGTTAPGITDITITNNILVNVGGGIDVDDYKTPDGGAGPFYLEHSLIAFNTVGSTYAAPDAGATPSYSIGVSDGVLFVNNLVAALDPIYLTGLPTTNPFSDGKGIADYATLVPATGLFNEGQPASEQDNVIGPPDLCGGSMYAASSYGLKTGSPAIDHGSSQGVTGVLYDFFGHPRLQGSAYDIGAVEGVTCP